jgi:hypothetical protein
MTEEEQSARDSIERMVADWDEAYTERNAHGLIGHGLPDDPRREQVYRVWAAVTDWTEDTTAQSTIQQFCWDEEQAVTVVEQRRSFCFRRPLPEYALPGRVVLQHRVYQEPQGRVEPEGAGTLLASAPHTRRARACSPTPMSPSFAARCGSTTSAVTWCRTRRSFWRCCPPPQRPMIGGRSSLSTAALASIHCQLPLSEIYDRVAFDPLPAPRAV